MRFDHLVKRLQDFEAQLGARTCRPQTTMRLRSPRMGCIRSRCAHRRRWSGWPLSRLACRAAWKSALRQSSQLIGVQSRLVTQASHQEQRVGSLPTRSAGQFDGGPGPSLPVWKTEFYRTGPLLQAWRRGTQTWGLSSDTWGLLDSEYSFGGSRVCRRLRRLARGLCGFLECMLVKRLCAVCGVRCVECGVWSALCCVYGVWVLVLRCRSLWWDLS